MIYRVGETSGEKVVQVTKQVVNFNLHVVVKEKKKIDEVNIRLEEALKAYEEKRKEVNERDNLIWKLRKQLRKRVEVRRPQRALIAASPTLAPLNGPMIEILGTPGSPKYYTNEELE